MTRKNLFRATLLIVMMVCLIFSSNLMAAKKMTIKISHVSSPGSARDLGSHEMKRIIEKETNGQVKVEVYPSSQLGGQRDQVEGAQFGTIELVVVPTSYLGGFQPLVTLLDCPFLMPEDKDQLLEMYKSKAVRDILDTTEEIGIKTLSIWHTGYKQWTANKPLTKPEDFKGLKVRVMASPVLVEQDKALGAEPITMDFAETYSALQSRAIDGQENPYDTTYDMKFHEVQSHITITNHSTLDQVVLTNKKWFESLPMDLQQIIQKAADRGAEVAAAKTYERIEEVLVEFKKQGVTLVKITPEQRQKFFEAVAPVREFCKTHFGAKGRRLFEALEKEASKYK